MSIITHILSNSNEIKQYEEELKLVAEATISLVEKLLPIKDVDIVFTKILRELLMKYVVLEDFRQMKI